MVLDNIEDSMEGLLKTINEEMKRYSSRFTFLNNFYMNLPDDTYEHGGYYRDLAVKVGVWINNLKMKRN